MARKSTPDHKKNQGTAPAAGASFDPKQGHEEGPPAAGAPSRSVPHGLPISESEYRKLKEEAAKTPGPRAKKAQEDSSTKNEDDE